MSVNLKAVITTFFSSLLSKEPVGQTQSYRSSSVSTAIPATDVSD